MMLYDVVSKLKCPCSPTELDLKPVSKAARNARFRGERNECAQYRGELLYC